MGQQLDRLIAATLGRIVPKYRTCAEWAETYRQTIELRQICAHTKRNRNVSVSHIVRVIGPHPIGSVRPLLIGQMIRIIAQEVSPQCAKRVLFEVRDFFNEAILAGVIDHNPASPIKAPRVKVLRQRLTFKQWQQIRAWSVAHQPPWVSRMMDLALVTGQRRSDLVKMAFGDVWDEHLHIEQRKTGTRLALPIALRLTILGKSIGDVIEDCRTYAAPGATLVRRQGGRPLCDASLSARFEEARDGAGLTWSVGTPPSLHECRSLAEREYRRQGIDTRILLGHKHQSMTDAYNDDRGLSSGAWLTLGLTSPTMH